MSSKPIMYSSHDAGAPQVASVAVQNRHAQSLKNILVPALVTGYGDKPAAGWKLVHEHELGFTLSSGDGSFFVNFVSNLSASNPYPAMHSQTIHVYAATSFSGSDGAKMQGANLCSGTYRSGNEEASYYHRNNLGDNPAYIFWNARNEAQWSIVADSKTFVFNVSVKSNDSGVVRYSLSIYAGEVASNTPAKANLVIGGSIDRYDGYTSISGLGRGYTMPINPLNGLSESVDVRVYPDNRLSSRAGGSVYQTRNHIELFQPFLLADNKWFGKLRGVVNDPMIAEYSYWQDYLIQLGFDPDFNNCNKPIDIDGHLYCYARHASCGGMYMTTNPEFW